jgi:FkbM family methyltransferase
LNLRVHPGSREAFEHFCFRAPEMVVELDSFIEHTQDKRRLLDIGALHGIFSLVFAANHPEKSVVAVDASPVAFARLLYNIHCNGLSQITPVECALSESAGTLRMHYEWEHAVAANTEAADSAAHLLSVVRRTGDELCGSLSFEPDVIKMDVEGHEVKVFKGLAKVIERHRPLIFLELHPTRIAEERDDVKDLVRPLLAAGYQASLIGGDPFPIQEMSRFTTDQRLLLSPA